METMEIIEVQVGREKVQMLLRYIEDMSDAPVLSQALERKGFHPWIGYARRRNCGLLIQVYRKKKTGEYVAEGKTRKF